MTQKVLVVDDDPAISEMLTLVLSTEGFASVVVNDGGQAVEVFQRENPDLVLLDLMLPGMNGIDICRAIRQESTVPIVMLTAKTDTVDVVLGLESGADDYIPKPFKPKELVARVRARLRRSDESSTDSMEVGDLLIPGMGKKSPSPHWNSICSMSWLANQGKSSPGKNYYSECGGTEMPPTPVW